MEPVIVYSFWKKSDMAQLKDRRELILSRLMEIGVALPGIEAAFRNSDTVPEKARPAFLLSDGDEFSTDADREAQIQRVGIYKTTMTPAITLFASGSTDTMEKTLSDIRVELVNAVCTDETIKSLTHPTGNVRYNGCRTSDEFGRRLEGELRVDFEFTYPFKVGETV
jgi:hypothetical protein